MKPSQRIAALLSISIAGVLLALLVSCELARPVDIPNVDFFAFWLAGDLSRTGGDPYSPAQWTDRLTQAGAGVLLDLDQTFLYPRPLAVLFEPLSLLDLRTAYIAWNALSLLALAGAVLLLLSLYLYPDGSYVGADTRHYLLPLLAGAFLFRPIWPMLHYGQLSAFLLLDLAGAAWLWSHHRWAAGGALLSLLALKPQLGLPVLVMAGLWLLAHRRWTALAGMLAGGIGLLALGWLADPGWVAKFLAVGSGKLGATFGYSPTLWGLAAWLSGFHPARTLALGGLAALACIGLAIWRLRRISDPALALSGMTVAALLITPYLWSYDQTLLLLPIAVCTLSVRSRLPYLVGALLPLLFCGLAIVCQLMAMRVQLDLFNGWLSLVVLALWLAATEGANLKKSR